MRGPNFTRLVAAKMAADAIPKGGGFKDGLDFLLDSSRVLRAAQRATRWATAAVSRIRAAPDNSFDGEEAICAEILLRLEAQRTFSRN